jgi:hypothetical protein
VRLAISAIAAALVAAPAAQGADYTLRAEGSSTTRGKVTAIGDFKPQADPTVGAAIRAFGQPSSMKTRGNSSCRMGWRALGLRITFVNLGAPGNSACEPSVGKAQIASVFGRVWRTARGLKVRSSTRKLRRLYPRAFRRGRTYRLVGARQIYAPGNARYSVLAAKTRRGRVGAFKLDIGAAGE